LKKYSIKPGLAVFKLQTLSAQYKPIVQIWYTRDTMGYWRCWHGIHEVTGSNPCTHSSPDDATCPCLPWLLSVWPCFEGIIFEWMDHKLGTLFFIYSFTGCLSRPWGTLSTYITYSGLEVWPPSNWAPPSAKGWVAGRWDLGRPANPTPSSSSVRLPPKIEKALP
jgi:hypothetical protein